MSKILELIVLSLRDALDDGDCGTCGNRLAWGFNSNQENPEWTSKCCNFDYHITVNSVEIFRGVCE